MHNKKIGSMTLDEFDKLQRQKKHKRRKKRKKIFNMIIFMLTIIFFVATGISFGMYTSITENPNQIKKINVMPNI